MQIAIHMLLTVIIIVDKFLCGLTLIILNDFEAKKYEVLVFLAIFGCSAHCEIELQRNG